MNKARKPVKPAINTREAIGGAVFDILDQQIAVLDGDGVIVAVNASWLNFAVEIGPGKERPARHSQIGTNYLRICRASTGTSSAGAQAAYAGITAVLDGSLPNFSLEYPCNSPTEQRWFIMQATPADENRCRVVISHSDITDRKQAEASVLRYQYHLEELVAERTLKLQSMATQLLTTEMRERSILAAELHDDLGQNLALAKLKLGLFEELGEGLASANYLQAMKAIELLVDQANASVRSFSVQLSPLTLMEFGLVAALESLADDFQRVWGLNVKLHQCNPEPLNDVMAGTLFRIVRELLLNVLKHARVSEAELIMARDADSGMLEITVADDGIGFDVEQNAAATSATGYGLGSIRQRIEFIGGKMSIDSEVGHGTIVSLTLPTEPVRQQ